MESETPLVQQEYGALLRWLDGTMVNVRESYVEDSLQPIRNLFTALGMFYPLIAKFIEYRKNKGKKLTLDTVSLMYSINVEMKEEFYLIAERDYAYNSSIGYVKEDTARFVFESGNPIKERAIVLKNKYGHQLKAPFPYEYEDKAIPMKYEFPISISENETALYFYVKKTFLKDRKEENETRKNKPKVKLKTNEILVEVNKMLLYENVSKSVSNLDDELNRFYKDTPKVELDKTDPITLFLY
jgi:hypothetical protein